MLCFCQEIARETEMGAGALKFADVGKGGV